MVSTMLAFRSEARDQYCYEHLKATGIEMFLTIDCPLFNQCLKCRIPVNTIARLCSFAPSMTSSSRTDPPG
jgi:hypothetical protein